MSVLINKDTKVYGSFSHKAGNRGCHFFNAAFEKYGINAIYKSFSVSNIQEAFAAATTLGFSGWAISMPFKKTALALVDSAAFAAKKCQAINTVVRDAVTGKTTGYNTDYIGALEVIQTYRGDAERMFILGNGGLSSAVQVACMDAGLVPIVITRKNWNTIESLRGEMIYNCTPEKVVVDNSNVFLDCAIGTSGGDLLAEYQSRKQFELYTGQKYVVS